VRAVGIIVVSTDRGLAGALNLNLFKSALASIASTEQEREDSTSARRTQGAAIFSPPVRRGAVGVRDALGDRPHAKDLIGPIKVMLDLYREEKIDHCSWSTTSS